MEQVLPRVRGLVLLTEGAFPVGKSLPFDDPVHGGSLEALRVRRREGVAS